MKTFATYNLKGGVGKTAAAVNLAWLSARDGARTLLWDLDSQGAASFYLGVKPKVKGGADRVLGKHNKHKELREVIRPTQYERLDVIPADFSYRHLDADLRDAGEPKRRLAKMLDPLAKTYDYAFLDCPPSLSLLSENVFEAADYLLVPLIPTPLSLRAYDQLQQFFGQRAENGVKLWPYFSMVDRRRHLHCQVVTEFVTSHPEVLRCYVPYSSVIERMGLHQAPVGVYGGSEAAGRAFEALWQVIKERIG